MKGRFIYSYWIEKSSIWNSSFVFENWHSKRIFFQESWSDSIKTFPLSNSVFRIIKFVNEKELEEIVPKSEWISDLKGPAVYNFDGTKLNLPDDFPDQNFCHSLAYWLFSSILYFRNWNYLNKNTLSEYRHQHQANML